MTDQVVKFVSELKIQIFWKKTEWPPNDHQMTLNDPQWLTNEHPANPQWLPMTISWDIFGSQMLKNEILHLNFGKNQFFRNSTDQTTVSILKPEIF